MVRYFLHSCDWIEHMATILPGCRDARVIWDHNTGRSKGYGFVSFRRKEDAEAAIEKMHGKNVGSRCIRVGWAQHKQVGFAFLLFKQFLNLSFTEPVRCVGLHQHAPVLVLKSSLFIILNCIQDESYLNMDVTAVDRADPANTNVYLGNISPETSEEDLMLHYAGEKRLNRRGFKH